jgi:hypothetical protein
MKRSFEIGTRYFKTVIMSKPTNKRIQIKCDCGVVKSIDRNSFYIVKSCGCSRIDGTFSKHGLAGTRIYNCWNSMKYRCTNPQSKFYKDYGGRGIKVCDSWLSSIHSFISDMGPMPDNMTLERIDVNGDYCKENCKWATRKEQARNTRRSKKVKYNGGYVSFSFLAELGGISPSLALYRYKAGWSVDKIISQPSRNKESAPR